MSKPLSIKALIFISSFQVIMLIVMTSMAFIFAYYEISSIDVFRNRLIQNLGFNPESYGVREASILAADYTVAGFFPFIILLTTLLRWRWVLYPITILSLANLLILGTLHIITITVVVLVFLKSSRHYLAQVESEDIIDTIKND